MSKQDENVAAVEIARIIQEITHYLPTQAPLKDFIHHNTLHAFQNFSFHEGVQFASQQFGFKVYLTLKEYREKYASREILPEILTQEIEKKFPKSEVEATRLKLLYSDFPTPESPRIGQLRRMWKSVFEIDLDGHTHPILFRLLGSFLDQGISIWNFPSTELGFLEAVRELERTSAISIFKTKHMREAFLSNSISLEHGLKRLVGLEDLLETYLFDQQFAHPGWSGMVAVLEKNPAALVDARQISFTDFIWLEVLLEIDTLDHLFGSIWSPLASLLDEKIEPIFSKTKFSPLNEALEIWQNALEWSYYAPVLNGFLAQKQPAKTSTKSFQALLCMDDREGSFRRHLERFDPACETFGTPGFFNIPMYYQPQEAKFLTKVCPAPLQPKHVVREFGAKSSLKKEAHIGKRTHGLVVGFLLTHSMGIWSGLKLAKSIFFPAQNVLSVSPTKHMLPGSQLTILRSEQPHDEGELREGFTIEEMVDLVEQQLKSIGLVNDFAPLIYVISHGSSSVNNTHFAGYDCGACSGRPGSVNARVFADMANRTPVRELLHVRGINIPSTTHFIAALHDTSRDEISYFDCEQLPEELVHLFDKNAFIFNEALACNAKERSRKFTSINSDDSTEKVHRKVKRRTVSLFEPRPELNHASNALCVVGRRDFSSHLFFDRRAFMNSYDWKIDVDGSLLTGILNAVAPVAGGINLEYYFSRTDNTKLGAGSKLPHNVMGLIGVANGIDGDLRTGLPYQMVEVHDPIRLLVVVEQKPAFVLDVLKRNASTFRWFEKDWIKIVAIDPESNSCFLFDTSEFKAIQLPKIPIQKFDPTNKIRLKSIENLAVLSINE